MKSLISVLTFLLLSGMFSPLLAQPETPQSPEQPTEQQPELPSTKPGPESPPEPPQLPGEPSKTPPAQPETSPAQPESPEKPDETPGAPVDPATNPLAVAAQGVPHSVTLLAEVHEPVRLLNDLQNYFALFTAADPQLKTRYEQGYNSLKALLGGDPYQPAELKALGLDPHRPWRISLLELDGRMEPAGVVLSAAVSDPKELDDTLEKVFLKQNLSTKETTQDDRRIIQVFAADGTTPLLLLMREEDYLHLFISGSSQDILQGLKDYTQEAARRPLSRDRRFHPVTLGLTPQADVSGYLNLKSIADRLPLRDTPALLNDFSSAAFQLSSREWNTQVLLSRYSGVAAFLQPGSGCQDLIGQADPPLVALTYSLEQPVPLLHYLMSNLDPTGVGVNFAPENVLGTGMTLEQLAELLRDGSGGLLFYEGENYQSNSFVVLACFQVTDRDAGHKWMARMAEEKQKAFYPNLKDAHLMPDTQVEQPAGIQLKQYGPNTVWTVKTTTSGIAYAQVGDFVIMGDAVKQIHNLARGEGDGWKPHCGSEELFSAEVRVGEFLKSLARHQDKQEGIPPALEAIDRYFGNNYHLVGSVKFEEGLLKTSVKPALGTFGETGVSLALLPYWAELAAGWTRKVYSEEYAYPAPEPNPAEPTQPMPQPEPEPGHPQPVKPPRRLTPGGEDIEPAPREPKTPAQPKGKPVPSGGDEGPMPAPESPEKSTPPKQSKEAQPGGQDEREPGEPMPQPMAPGNAQPKSPPADQAPSPEKQPGENDGPGQPAPQENQESEPKQPAPGKGEEPKPKKLVPGGEQEPENQQPAPEENQKPKKPAPGGDQEPEGKQPPGLEEKPQPKKPSPEAEPAHPGSKEPPELKEPSPKPDEPLPESKKEPQPGKPGARPEQKTEPAPGDSPEPKQDNEPKPKSQPGPEQKNSSRGDKAPSAPGQKASEGGGEGPNIPFKEETKRHMAPLFHGIRIISGRSLGEVPGQLPIPKAEPPASPDDETSLDAGRSRQPSALE